MLTVACVLWANKYPKSYVETLRQGVERNLTIEHDFICITDQDVECKTIKPIVDWPGWWQKIQLFNSDLMPKGRILYFDLDVLITGRLDNMLNDTAPMTLMLDPNPKEGRTVNSSVMYFDNEHMGYLWDAFSPQSTIQQFHGDQEYIQHTMNCLMNVWPTTDVVSYKSHCKDGLPEGAKVCVFHGRPDYHEVRDQWVQELRQRHK